MHSQGPQILKTVRNPGHIPALFEMLARIEFRLTDPMDHFLTKSPVPLPGGACLYFSYDAINKTSPMVRTKVPLTNVICRPGAAESVKQKGVLVRSCFLEEIPHGT